MKLNQLIAASTLVIATLTLSQYSVAAIQMKEPTIMGQMTKPISPAMGVGSYEISRSKQRIPGGSGCDDARDILEHPECRTPKNYKFKYKSKMHHHHNSNGYGRSKSRIPGGSGCDSVRDIREHAACRL